MLAGLSWHFCNHLHPPTLRYSLAGGRGNPIFFKQAHVKNTTSEEIPHLKHPEMFHMKVFAYRNMKSTRDHREERIIRKIKFTSIEAYYDSIAITTNNFYDFNYVKHRFTEQSSGNGPIRSTCMILEAICLAWLYCAASVAALGARCGRPSTTSPSSSSMKRRTSTC